MNLAYRALLRFLKRAMGNQAGIAAVEFALILPVMLTLYIGSVELTTAFTVDKRVTTVSGTVGDLVSRNGNAVTEAQLSDFFAAARTIMAPYSSDNLSQIVTSLYVDKNGKATVRWSRKNSSGANSAGYAVGSTYALPKEMADIAHERFVIVSQAQLSYKPILSYVFQGNFNLEQESFFLPRAGGEVVLKP